MNGPTSMDSSTLYLEIGQSTLNVLNGESGLELPLERLENGRLTGPCQERVITSLQTFLKQPNPQTRLRALCAVGARGVSFRRVSIPPPAREDVTRVLGLQVESEFPLPPDELAWGYRKLDPEEQPKDMPAGHQAYLIAAVKKEILEDYASLLVRCGVSPSFTLAALARGCLWPHSNEAYAALDIGRQQSELISFEQGVPTSVRILPWGGESITEAIQEKLGVSHEEAEKLKIRCDRELSSATEAGPIVESATDNAVDLLTKSIRNQGAVPRLSLTGRSTRQKRVATQLAAGLGCRVESEPTEPSPGPGRSAAIQGLRISRQKNGRTPLLILQVKDAAVAVNPAQPATWKLVKIAAALLVACLMIPYAEALLLKPYLSKKLAEVDASRDRLKSIDREFQFLRALKTNQPPYLDAIFLMAGAAPQGTRFDSISMNRRGEVSLRGNMKDSQQVLQFRSKLIDSGFFSSVVVEEQAPTPDRQKLVVRMTAQWQSATARDRLKLGPTPEEMEKIKATAKELGPGGPQMMMGGPSPMPPGVFPPGRDMPMPSQGIRSGLPSRPGSNAPSSRPPINLSVPLERKD